MKNEHTVLPTPRHEKDRRRSVLATMRNPAAVPEISFTVLAVLLKAPLSYPFPPGGNGNQTDLIGVEAIAAHESFCYWIAQNFIEPWLAC